MTTAPGTAPMRASSKTFLTIEVAVCFGPIVLMLFLGAVIAPFQILHLVGNPLDWRAAVGVVVMVVSGMIGLATLVFVLDKLFRGYTSINRPSLVCIGVAVGALPLLPAFQLGSLSIPAFEMASLGLFGFLPLAATAHILFLARGMLFSPWQVGLKRAAVALAVALPVLAIPLLDPSRASSDTIREQQALWESSAPKRYEFTIQTSGFPPVESGIPRRIWVEQGKAVSAKYVWNLDEEHKAGDPVPTDDLLTIDRVFLELLAAKERGWEVNVAFDERRGFVEQARANPNDGSNGGWGVKVWDFNETPLAAIQ